MLRQLMVGGLVSVCNIGIHALMMTTIVGVARAAGLTKRPHPSWFPSLFLICVMVSTVSVLMITHALEIFVWAFTYLIVGLAPSGTGLVYFAFVNYTTLGYGDVIPAERWQLLGPMTAMNGVLLFGWSTAVIFEVLRRTMSHAGMDVSQQAEVRKKAGVLPRRARAR
jgi:hypothetical protein